MCKENFKKLCETIYRLRHEEEEIKKRALREWRGIKRKTTPPPPTQMDVEMAGATLMYDLTTRTGSGQASNLRLTGGPAVHYHNHADQAVYTEMDYAEAARRETIRYLVHVMPSNKTALWLVTNVVGDRDNIVYDRLLQVRNG